MKVFQCAFVAAAWLLLSGQSFAAVVNGDFETGALAPWACVGDLCTVVSGTSHSGTFAFQGFSNAADGDLSQAMTTVAGTSYSVSAFVRTSGDPTNAVRLSLGANPPVTCAALTTTYALCAANFVALTNNDPVHLYFKTLSGTGTVFIDDVSVGGAAPVSTAPVPTLNEWALMFLAALLTFAGWLRLRKRISA
jgi:hypothetical protein